ncbi:NEDD4-binding protein 1 [Xyrauchen texanus]|uniref:NEDD4-binding protein 1 n=1 Tax=Xyrauchen texanus TaxID=154827 RepID=UPI002242BB31|nr:NEDD4-binding protein 1 [Xyrauchen texanus]XP_051996608.1 NEDD4-binding protein 1 [Xyrauchen texanus]XP_051996615.1 NEDD4-binding protein 1 [Xyrauchen texanus]
MALSALPFEEFTSQWTDVWTEGQEVKDEFTCSCVLRGALVALQPTVERVFGVSLNIGGEDTVSSQDGQIWLRLRGNARNVEAAKLFVKGVVNQEAQQEIQFPEVLHCVFCGAKGLFMDCLIKNTSAHILVGSQGCLLITGLAEPVMKAYSYITDLAEKYSMSQGRRPDCGLGTAGESLDSRRAFKSMVENLEDRHILDLLVLPVIVKEALLDLVKQSGLDRGRGLDAERSQETLKQLESNESWAMQRTINEMMFREPEELGQNKNRESAVIQDRPNMMSMKSHSKYSGAFPQYGYQRFNGTDDIARRMTDFSESQNQLSHSFLPVPTHRTHPENLEVPQRGSPQEVESEMPPQETVLLSAGSREEFEHLLKFFTAMGFNEEVVNKVLARTGPKEASQILDLIQQEQDKSDQQRDHCNTKAQNKDNVARIRAMISEGLKEAAEILETSKDEPESKEDDFVLGVLKKAAATCGYTEERVEEVYSNLPELNPHELLLELQRQGVKESNRRKDSNTGAEQTIGRNSEADVKYLETGGEKTGTEARTTGIVRQPDTTKLNSTALESPTISQNQPPLHSNPPLSVRGPPQTTYPSKPTLENLDLPDINPNVQLMNPHIHSGSLHPQSVPQNNHLSFPKVPNISNLQQHVSLPKQRQGKSATASVVTGPQRFLEGLKMPFKLELSDDPGNSMLRQIIIDGSNVAMSHGLGVFFSCRGIALAVQHFWGKGHRKITVFVPQWRQKKHHNIKEKQYLTELQDLGLLSFTPSREVEGKRINSYDDRFMLALAQNTNGVIVTNDNLRDLVDESPAWRNIIKKSLLQYVFAGDLFMLPDDPMGRGGPHLNDFLQSQNSNSPVPGSHSFAGMSSSIPSASPAPRAYTEVLQYRDWTPQGQRRKEVMERTVDETLKLKESLMQIFPDQESVIIMILQCHPTIRSMNELTDFILEQQE